VLSNSGSYNQPFRFQTKLSHTRSGIGYWGYRWYDYKTGRWLGRDKIGETGGLNLYGYCGGQPLGRSDPFGLWSIALGFGASGNAGIPHGSISLQGTASFNGWNPLDWRSGWTFSIGGGAGAGMGFSGGLIGSFSLAERTEAWNGDSSTGGGTFGDGLTFGGDVSNINTEDDGCPRDKVKNLKYDGTFNFGGYLPTPGFPVEFHYDTSVRTWGHSASIRDLF
jgi:RHS repeat-associated protein